MVRYEQSDNRKQTNRVVLSKIYIKVCKFLPGNEFTRCAVDGLPSELDGPFVFPFRSKEVALNVKKGISLRGLSHSRCHDLHCLHFLV